MKRAGTDISEELYLVINCLVTTLTTSSNLSTHSVDILGLEELVFRSRTNQMTISYSQAKRWQRTQRFQPACNITGLYRIHERMYVDVCKDNICPYWALCIEANPR